MKKYFLSLVTVLCISFSVSNAQPYIFSQYTSAYANLSSPTTISSPFWDDFTVYTLPLPFTFNYFGANFTTIYVMGGFEGFVYTGTGSGGTFGSYEIYSYDNAMTDFNGTATISYQVTGSAPSRILKIQTLNANFDSDDTGNDYANFQLWLYEGTNVIEMHYGPSSILGSLTWGIPGCAGPTVTIVKDPITYVSLSGPASNPSASSTTGSLCVTGAPPNGKVYKFAPNSMGIEYPDNNIQVTLSPNPSSGMFTVASGYYMNSYVDMSIKNSLGQTVQAEKIFLPESGHTLRTELESGIYFLHIRNETGSTVRKMIVE